MSNAYMNKGTYVCKLEASTHDCIMNYGTFSFIIVLGVQIQIPASLIPVMSMLSVLEAVRTIKTSCVNATPHFKATD